MTQGQGTGRAIFLLAVLGFGALPLEGCDSFNRAIGKTRVIPDEFQVVSNAPLAIPPDYTLRPPRVGIGADDQSPTDQARESVFRVAEQQQASLPAAQSGRSPGELDLLREAGATNVPADIRKMVDADPKEGVPFERSLVDKLVFWEGPKTPPSSAVINPSEESSRLRLAQSVAKPEGTAEPANTGDAGTPTFERTTKKSSSWFGWLF
jgi:hypothetical protein